MDRDGVHCSYSVLEALREDELSNYQSYRHRRHASNISAAATHDPRGLRSRNRSRRETSPDSSASAPLHELQPSRKHVHMKRLSGISKTFSFPNLSSRVEDDGRPSSSPGAQPPSTPLLRAHTTPSLLRLSPSQKRKPPASHSSYGIETSNGPPPSYSTQQTLSQERVRPQERGRSQKPVPDALHHTASYDRVIQYRTTRSKDQNAFKINQGPTLDPTAIGHTSSSLNHFTNDSDDTQLATQNRESCTITQPVTTTSTTRYVHTPYSLVAWVDSAPWYLKSVVRVLHSSLPA